MAPALQARAGLDAQSGAAAPFGAAAYVSSLEVAVTAASTAAARRLLITGGSVTGPRLEGGVQGGSIDFIPRADGRTMEVLAWFQVRQRDGAVIEVQEHGVVAGEGTLPTGPVATVAELRMAGDGVGYPGDTTLLAGRLDASDLHQGSVRTAAFEVS